MMNAAVNFTRSAPMTELERCGFARLMLRRPEWRERLCERSHRAMLRELCEAYELACTAAWHWGNSSQSGARALVDEYNRVVSEIEDEIGHVMLRF